MAHSGYPELASVADNLICPGKLSWPELEGACGCVAKKIIEKENPNVEAIVITEGTPVPLDYACNRVWVVINSSGNVIRVPAVG